MYSGFTESSIQIADSISHSEAFSVTGGGDTSTVILENNLEDNFSFISTGGGAMLDFLVDGSLPGIDIILTQKETSLIKFKVVYLCKKANALHSPFKFVIF